MAKLALTRNNMGWAAEKPNRINRLFVDYCATGACGETSPALDIGAAYGLATIAALEAGAHVIANDLAPAHLEEIFRRTPEASRARLQLKAGRFPHQIHFEPETLGAIHASNVFHFLTGNQLSYGVRSAARWLRPGGKLFVQAATPYQAQFAGFIPEYQRRLAAGVKWPGWVEKISRYSQHKKLGVMPASIHLLDDRTLVPLLEAAGFRVERAWLYQREDFPAELKLDGRESLGIVAIRNKASIPTATI